jgi:putative tryptophan/tyrosine transport system substrate-binding protein
VASWPLTARAQQPDIVRRIGVLTGDAEDDPGVKARLAAFQQGLDRLGWLLDRNVRIDYRFAANNPDQYQPLAKELIRLQPDVLLAYTTPVAAAFVRESRTIPIVFVNVSDPIGSGLVAGLARPGGNLAGLLLYEEGITGKWLAMLKEIAPGLSRAALIANPKRTPYDYFVGSAKSAAPSLAIELAPSPVENAADIERVIKPRIRGQRLLNRFCEAYPSDSVLAPNCTEPIARGLIRRLRSRPQSLSITIEHVPDECVGVCHAAT